MAPTSRVALQAQIDESVAVSEVLHAAQHELGWDQVETFWRLRHWPLDLAAEAEEVCTWVYGWCGGMCEGWEGGERKNRQVLNAAGQVAASEPLPKASFMPLHLRLVHPSTAPGPPSFPSPLPPPRCAAACPAGAAAT